MKNNNKIIMGLSLFAMGLNQANAADFSQIKPMVALVVSIGYLIGLVLFITGLYGFKKHSENPQQFTIAYCVMNMATGILLLLSGYFYSSLKSSTIDQGWSFDGESALSIDNAALADVGSMSNSLLGQYLPEQTIAMLIGFVYLVGLIAFIKGIYMLKNVGSVNSGHEGGIGKALTHMAGGLVSMNIVQFSCIMGNATGISMLCIGG